MRLKRHILAGQIQHIYGTFRCLIFPDKIGTYIVKGLTKNVPLKKSMRLLPRASDSSDYQDGLFKKQEPVWLNLCGRAVCMFYYMKGKFPFLIHQLADD